MEARTILVVEDNDISRKMMRLALEAEGYAVLEAPDGRTALELIATVLPDLIIQDLILPDIDGLELVKRLRTLPGCADIPILAVSGFLSKMEQARSINVGFTDYVFKPVEPSLLLKLVRLYLFRAGEGEEKPGRGLRVLVVDDDPMQRKLMRLLLTDAGFNVTVAAHGAEALDQASQSRPDVILSDIMMPHLDGFQLCMAVRQDSRTANIPVVFVSAMYLEEADRQLASDVGANAFVTRMSDYKEIVETLLAAIRSEVPPVARHRLPLAQEVYAYRLIRQLEKQVQVNQNLTAQMITQRAQFSILSAATESVIVGGPIDAVLRELLHRCLNAAGVSKGAVYLLEPDGRFSLGAQLGYAETAGTRCSDFFGHEEVLRQVVEDGKALVISILGMQEDRARDLLAKADTQSMLLVPILWGERRVGVFYMASAGRVMGDDWIGFATTMATQIAQAIVQTRAFSQLAQSEIRKAAIFDSAPDCIVTMDGEGRIVEFNPAAQRTFGYTSVQAVGNTLADLIIPPELRERHRQGLARYLATGESSILGRRLEFTAMRADGTEFPVEVGIIRIPLDGPPMFTGWIRDITERKQAEATRQALYRASLEIQEPTGLQERLDRLLQTAQTVLELDRVNILLADPERQWLQAVASLGAEESLEAIRVPIGPEGGALSHAFRTQEAVLWDGRNPVPASLRLQPPFDQIKALRSRAFVAVPLVVQGRAIGVLGADRRQSRRSLGAATREMLQLFVTQAALAIEQARLYEAQRMAAIQLEAKVEDRTRDLQEAMLLLEAGSKHKSEFLANMSHELRTPLNSILGFSDLLRDQQVGPLTEKQARYVHNIRESGRHLLTLINDLLDLSKVEAGKLELRPQAFDLREAIEAALTEVRPQILAKALVVTLHVDELPSLLTADPVRFKQILLNLLSNAIKFTPKGGSIAVTGKQVRSAECGVRSETDSTSHLAPRASDVVDFVEIAVADTGVGIKPEDLPKLFQPFTQLEGSFAKQYHGTGLGLALTKTLVEAHGGTVRAESEGEGRGSTFRIRLPLTSPA